MQNEQSNLAPPIAALRNAPTLNRITPKNEPRACPSCGQMVKLYRRSVHATMAVQLIRIFKAGDLDSRNWVDTPELFRGMRVGGGDYAKAAYWNLLEPRPGARSDGSSRNGWWRMSSHGVMFVRGCFKIRQFALIFNKEVHGFDGEMVNIRQCLGRKYDYSELMKGI